MSDENIELVSDAELKHNLLCLASVMRQGWPAESVGEVVRRWESNIHIGIDRAGTRPRTVEVGMLICRLFDGQGPGAWRVVKVGGPVAGLRHVDANGQLGTSRDQAVASIVHQDGGWILAEDWIGLTAETVEAMSQEGRR